MTTTMQKTLQNISEHGTVRALSQKHQHKGALKNLAKEGYVEYRLGLSKEGIEWWGYWPTGKEI